MEKSKTDVISVTMPLLRQAIWGHILKRTMEKSQTNATNVTLHAFENKQWRKFKQMSGEQMFYNQQPSQLARQAIYWDIHILGQIIQNCFGEVT